MTAFYALLLCSEYSLIFKTIQHCSWDNSDDEVVGKSVRKEQNVQKYNSNG